MEVKHKILLVDDEEFILVGMRDCLVRHGYLVETATSGDEAIEKVKAAPFEYALIVLDYRMPGKDGATTAREILSITQDLFVLIHSGDTTRDAMKMSWHSGAVTFIEKGASAEKFIETIAFWWKNFQDNILTASAGEGERQEIIKRVGFVGASQSLLEVASLIESLQEEKIATVLILGESGTGKEAVANAVHRNSPRRNGPFIAVNCGAVPESLAESTFFGHEKGAFSGAINKQKGKFEEARGGTLFLDEIAEASPLIQVKLLRALQEKVICPVGGKDTPIDVRIIAATNVNLKAAVAEGKFREDLFFRLNVIPITLKPLRERIEDIEPLAIHFCTKYSRTRGKTIKLLKSTVKALEEYPWPGNVRELDNIMMRAVVANPEVTAITPEHLGPAFLSTKKLNGINTQTLKNYLDDATKEYLSYIMKRSSTNVEAAKKAGVPESTFRGILKKFGLKKPNGSGSESSPSGS